MKKSNKHTEETDNDSDKEPEESEESDIDSNKDIKPDKKKTGKGNFVMTEARLTQLALAREKARLLRLQINESKTVPLKKEKGKSKLEIKLDKLKMDQTDIEEVEEPLVDLHKTIRQKPKPNQIQPVEIVEIVEPILTSIRKIGKYYFI